MAEPKIKQTFDFALQLHKAGQLGEAEKLYRQVLAQQPEHAGAIEYLGIIAHQAGRNEIGIKLIRQAIALNPLSAHSCNNLGNVLRDAGQLNEAIEAYRKAISLKFDLPEAHSNLGMTLREKGKLDEAVACYRQAIAIEPNLPEIYDHLGIAQKDQGQIDEAIASYRRAIELRPDYRNAHSNLIVALHYDAASDSRALAQEHRRWNQQHAQPLQTLIQAHPNNRDPNRRLRIGYVSPDFTTHPVGRFLLPILAHHDQNVVEVFAYAEVVKPDAITHRLRSHVNVWRNIVGLSDAVVTDIIRQDEIDVLIDLTMHVAFSRLLVFARKPAPVQVTYLAYCSSTGLETIDYRLSDPHLDPPGTDESVYSEQTIRLPDTYWCYRPIIDIPPAGALPALANGFVTFGCLNNFCKVSRPALRAWGRILQDVPNSRLLLHAHEGSHRERVIRELEQLGIQPTRIRFVGFMPIDGYFDLYREIDIALDTFPFGGGTTTCDASWMGVPSISLIGNTGVGRGGLSILSNLGLADLAAVSQEAYAFLAVQLAGNLPRLAELRATLRQRMEESPLMDASAFTRNIETAYRQMWRSWCQCTY